MSDLQTFHNFDTAYWPFWNDVLDIPFALQMTRPSLPRERWPRLCAYSLPMQGMMKNCSMILAGIGKRLHNLFVQLTTSQREFGS